MGNLYTQIMQLGLADLGPVTPRPPDCRLRKTCILQQNCSKTCILAS